MSEYMIGQANFANGGRSGPLLFCPWCGCAVVDTEVHDRHCVARAQMQRYALGDAAGPVDDEAVDVRLLDDSGAALVIPADVPGKIIAAPIKRTRKRAS